MKPNLDIERVSSRSQSPPPPPSAPQHLEGRLNGRVVTILDDELVQKVRLRQNPDSIEISCSLLLSLVATFTFSLSFGIESTSKDTDARHNHTVIGLGCALGVSIVWMVATISKMIHLHSIGTTFENQRKRLLQSGDYFRPDDTPILVPDLAYYVTHHRCYDDTIRELLSDLSPLQLFKMWLHMRDCGKLKWVDEHFQDGPKVCFNTLCSPDVTEEKILEVLIRLLPMIKEEPQFLNWILSYVDRDKLRAGTLAAQCMQWVENEVEPSEFISSLPLRPFSYLMSRSTDLTDLSQGHSLHNQMKGSDRSHQVATVHSPLLLEEGTEMVCLGLSRDSALLPVRYQRILLDTMTTGEVAELMRWAHSKNLEPLVALCQQGLIATFISHDKDLVAINEFLKPEAPPLDAHSVERLRDALLHKIFREDSKFRTAKRWNETTKNRLVALLTLVANYMQFESLLVDYDKRLSKISYYPQSNHIRFFTIADRFNLPLYRKRLSKLIDPGNFMEYWRYAEQHRLTTLENALIQYAVGPNSKDVNNLSWGNNFPQKIVQAQLARQRNIQ